MTADYMSGSVVAIEGLRYTPDFIGEDEEMDLLTTIDGQPWRNDLKRRVQHYGYRYDYSSKQVRPDSYLGPLPCWLETFVGILRQTDYLGGAPDQVIVNDYQPGQGIAPHVDCIPCFGPRIVILSLGSPCLMDFTSCNPGRRDELVLQPRSLLILSGPARYDWKHGIKPRLYDVVNGMKLARRRRVSVTFRTVLV